MLFGKTMKKLGKVGILHRRLIILEAIILALFYLAISWISISLAEFLRDSILSNYALTALFVLVLAVVARIVVSGNRSVKESIYADNMQRIYGWVDFRVKNRVPESAAAMIEMQVNMLQDLMKKTGRGFTPEVVSRINLAISRAEEEMR